jgi:hypothetical protein
MFATRIELAKSISIRHVRRQLLTTDSQIERFYAKYSIYKGKGALSLNPILPIYKVLSKGSKAIERDGSLLLEFAPISGNAPREYDWSRKQYFSLNVAEMGELIAIDKTQGLEFFHDPNLGSKMMINCSM